MPGRNSLVALSGVLALAGLLLAPSPVRADKPSPGLKVAGGARIAVINLLDAEVTYFHAAHRLQDSFLKTYPVSWSAGAMLQEALQERLTQLGLTPVPLPPGDALSHAREICFLEPNLAKGLPKDCAAIYAQFAAREEVAALIVLGPGLNDGDHAGSSRRKDLPDYLRGWCVVTAEGGAPPTLLNLTELLLIGPGAKGAVLVEREWGGALNGPASGFTPPADVKSLSEAQLAPLQGQFAALLRQQAAALSAYLLVQH